MAGVDPARKAPEESCELRSFQDRDPVPDGPGRAVPQRARRLGGQILEQRSPGHNVQGLAASADPQDGSAFIQGAPDQVEFEAGPDRAQWAEFRVGALAVVPGIDVDSSPRNQETVQDVERFVRAGPGGERGEEDRHASQVGNRGRILLPQEREGPALF